MIPSAIYEKFSTDNYLTTQCGITTSRVVELQSVDQRPFDDGSFIVLNWQESSTYGVLLRAPRVLTVWVHSPLDRGRDYRILDKILNRIDDILLSLEQFKGTDNVRITCVNKLGRSGNLIDEGWKTIARNATYRVLYDETTT